MSDEKAQNIHRVTSCREYNLMRRSVEKDKTEPETESTETEAASSENKKPEPKLNETPM